MPLIAFDYKSFHVLTLGFEAKDPLYMRMARLDMHSFFALVGLLRLEPEDKLEAKADSELQEMFKFYRAQEKQYPEYAGMTFEEIRNEKAKRAILGIGFGQGEFSLARLNPESFAGPADARKVLDRLNGLFPRPENWRQEIKMKADVEHKLVSRHGYVRYFWDVVQRKPVEEGYAPWGNERVWVHRESGQRWLLKPGDDAEAAIAFLPANDAFGTIRGVMIRLGENGLDEKYGLINQIHDALVFDCKRSLSEECISVVREEMERPNLVLTDPEVAPEGLACKVEVKTGMNLAEMKKVA